MGETGFEGIRKSVTRRQNTVVQYIATQPILDLYDSSTRQPGVRFSRRLWEQADIDLEVGEEQGRRGSNRIGVGVGVGFGRRGFDWSEWGEWSGVEWVRIVNPPRMTMGRK